MVKIVKLLRKLKFSLAVLSMLAILPALSAQEEELYSKQVWLDVNPRWIARSGKLMIAGSVGYRTIFPEDWNRYYLTLGARYSPFIQREEASPALQYLQFRAGISDYYTNSLESQNLNEVRLFQGVRVRWPIYRRVRMSHYVRLEERFEKVEDTDIREFTLRLRYRLTTEFRFIKPALINVYLPLSAEIFMSRGGIYFNDVTRITPGIGYDFTDFIATEFQLSYHFSRNSDTGSFENNDLVFRLRFYLTF